MNSSDLETTQNAENVYLWKKMDDVVRKGFFSSLLVIAYVVLAVVCGTFSMWAVAEGYPPLFIALSCVTTAVWIMAAYVENQYNNLLMYQYTLLAGIYLDTAGDESE